MTTSTPVIEAICRIPEDFRLRGDVSMVKLLEESGHLNEPTQLSEDALRQYIASHPEAIDSWAGHSESERSSEFWYLLRPEHPNSHGSWVVGFYPGGPRKSYADGAQACAAYIKRFVDDLTNYTKHAS